MSPLETTRDLGASPNGTVRYRCQLCHLPLTHLRISKAAWGHHATLLAVLQRSLSRGLAPAHTAKPL